MIFPPPPLVWHDGSDAACPSCGLESAQRIETDDEPLFECNLCKYVGPDQFGHPWKDHPETPKYRTKKRKRYPKEPYFREELPYIDLYLWVTPNPNIRCVICKGPVNIKNPCEDCINDFHQKIVDDYQQEEHEINITVRGAEVEWDADMSKEAVITALESLLAKIKDIR